MRNVAENKHKLNFSAEETGAKEEKLSSDAPKERKGRKPKKSMKQKQNLSFEENRVKPSARLRDDVKDLSREIPGKVTTNYIRSKVEENSDDNISVNAVCQGTEVTENVVRTTKTYARRRNRNVLEEKQNRKFTEEQSTVYSKEAVNRDESTASGTPAPSNAYSKQKQKQDIKKEYQAAKSGKTVSTTTSDKIESSAKNAVKDTKDKVVEFITDNKKTVLIVIGIVLSLVVGIGVLSSGIVIVQGTTGGVSLTTYPSDDSEMIGAESYYSALEENIIYRIDGIKSNNRSRYEYDVETNSYTSYYNGDVYVFNYKDVYHSLSINERKDETGHDPYCLISFLTAKNDCNPFKCDDMKSTMDTLCGKQYELKYWIDSYSVDDESTSTRYVYNYDNINNIDNSYYIYTTDCVTHHYYTLYIRLTNKTIEAVAPGLLTDEQLDMYEIYCETKGNREDLFE